MGSPHTHEHGDDHHTWRTLAIQSATCGALGLGAVIWSELYGVDKVFTALAALGCIAGAWEAVGEAWHALRYHRRVDVHLLMVAAAMGAWAVGQPLEGLLLLFLFSAAGAIEHFALDRTRRAVDALMAGAPTHARRPDGSLIEVANLLTGDALLLLPGDRIPADATVTNGVTEVDESTLTGEDAPVDKRPGDELMAGTLNGSGRILARVLRPESESAVQRTLRLIREAQSRKAPSQRLIDRWGSTYALGVLGASALFLLWLLATGSSFKAEVAEQGALYRAMTLLVVMSPCALVLSIPSAVLAAIAAGARRGVLFRGGAAVERLAEVDAICFDKTGTLTRGEPAVIAHACEPTSRESEALIAAASLGAASSHPLSRSVAAWCATRGAVAAIPEDFESVTGEGLRGKVGGREWRMGKRTFVGAPDPGVMGSDEGLGSEVWVSDGTVHLSVRLRDEVRLESKPVLAALAARGIRCLMLTGDKSGAAQRAAAEVGMPEVASGLRPWDKVEHIRRLSAEGRIVAMVGDGINDAPSLAAADVAVAMGGRGSDAAKETSDLLLVEDRLDRLVDAVDLSRRTHRIIRQNLVISMGTVVVMAFLTVAQGVPLPLGVLAHEGSTVIVCLNGLRLLKSSPRPRGLESVKN